MNQHTVKQGLPADVEELIGNALTEVDTIFRRELESSCSYSNELLAHVSDIQGKRLRPTLLLLIAAATGTINEQHKVLAAVVEMIHMATLVHDDILDDAKTRRHVDTINARWNNETSVLFGDYLFTHAFHLAASLETTLACRLIGQATNVVCEGELMQVGERGNIDLTEEQYFRIIEGKTAKLCAVSCYLGAHFSGVDESVSQAAEEFGRSLGMAFQIADDLLDVTGDEAETGKSLGSDFQKQKMTLPIIHLLNNANETDRQKLRNALKSPSNDSWQIVRSILQNSDSIEYAKTRAQEATDTALQQLKRFPESPVRNVLAEITKFAASRNH